MEAEAGTKAGEANTKPKGVPIKLRLKKSYLESGMLQLTGYVYFA